MQRAGNTDRPVGSNSLNGSGSSGSVDCMDQDEQGYFVDSTNAERRVWLVKIPDFFADGIGEMLDGMQSTTGTADEAFGASAPASGEEKEIGVVRIYAATADAPARVSVFLRKGDGGPVELQDCPREYDMKFVKSQQKMHLFSEALGAHNGTGTGRATAIEGRVEQECHLKPVLNDEYRAMLHQRTAEANRPARTIQVLDGSESGIRVGLVPHVRETDLLNRRRQRVVEVDQRRERLPEAEVMNMLFRAFEETPHWTLKGLSDHTRQPIVYVRDILSRIAIYNTRGPYKNLYELRPEYKG